MTKTTKPIPGYEGYIIDSSGAVFSSKRTKAGFMRQRKTSIDQAGYVRVILSSPGKKPSTRYVHRLVAEAFVPNPNGYSDVKHKDENKQNNSADNLVWTPHRDNIAKVLAPDGVWKIGGKNNRPIKCCANKDDKLALWTEYPSALAAAKHLGSRAMAPNIRNACKTGRIAYGHYWNYV